MYTSSEFEAETLEVLKNHYANYYADSFINMKNVNYICDEESELPESEVNDFINDVNDIIDNNRLEY